MLGKQDQIAFPWTLCHLQSENILGSESPERAPLDFLLGQLPEAGRVGQPENQCTPAILSGLVQIPVLPQPTSHVAQRNLHVLLKGSSILAVRWREASMCARFSCSLPGLSMHRAQEVGSKGSWTGTQPSW